MGTLKTHIVALNELKEKFKSTQKCQVGIHHFVLRAYGFDDVCYWGI